MGGFLESLQGPNGMSFQHMTGPMVYCRSILQLNKLSVQIKLQISGEGNISSFNLKKLMDVGDADKVDSTKSICIKKGAPMPNNAVLLYRRQKHKGGGEWRRTARRFYT